MGFLCFCQLLKAYYADPTLESGAGKLKETWASHGKPSRGHLWKQSLGSLVLATPLPHGGGWKVYGFKGHDLAQGEGLASIEFLQRHWATLQLSPVFRLAWRHVRVAAMKDDVSV